MPKQKDLKRLTRSRMQKTGESYTTARAHLLNKKTRSSSPVQPTPAEYATLAGMSDDAVQAKTGHTWAQWVQILDAEDATSMPHSDIAKHVHETFDISGWWAQTVTVGYERIRGLREVGQRRGGSYETSKSKTLPVPLATLYRAFSEARTRQRWLPGVEMTIRKETPEKSMRITWEDDTSVEVYFTAKGEEKSQVAVQHRKLATKAEASTMKEYWSGRLDALTSILVPSAL